MECLLCSLHKFAIICIEPEMVMYKKISLWILLYGLKLVIKCLKSVSIPSPCFSDRTREGSEDNRSIGSAVTPEVEAVLNVISPCRYFKAMLSKSCPSLHCWWLGYIVREILEKHLLNVTVCHVYDYICKMSVMVHQRCRLPLHI